MRLSDSTLFETPKTSFCVPVCHKAGEGGEDEEDDTGDPPRVWLKQKMVPGCAFTRSIGDSIGESVGVYAVPEVLVKEITDADKYIILASDGVWEVRPRQ